MARVFGSGFETMQQGGGVLLSTVSCTDTEAMRVSVPLNVGSGVGVAVGTESEAMQPMVVDKPDLVISKSDNVIKLVSIRCFDVRGGGKCQQRWYWDI